MTKHHGPAIQRFEVSTVRPKGIPALPKVKATHVSMAGLLAKRIARVIAQKPSGRVTQQRLHDAASRFR